MNYFQRELLLILNSKTRAIICSVPSYTTARAILLSSLEIGMLAVPITKSWCPAEFRNKDFNNLDNNFKIEEPDKLGIKPLKLLTYEPEDLIAWKTKRKEFLLRIAYLEALDWHCQNIMIPNTITPYINDYMPSIIEELQKSDPLSNTYTPAIESYAKITDCSPATAYQELKMHTDNINHVRMRNLAIYIKYTNMLNTTPPIQEKLQSVMELAKDELFRNSLV